MVEYAFWLGIWMYSCMDAFSAWKMETYIEKMQERKGTIPIKHSQVFNMSIGQMTVIGL